MLPKILKNYNLFVDGLGLAGKIEEVNPPKLTLKTEEYRAGGMDAPTEIDMGMEKLECDFTLAEYEVEVLKLFGIASNSAVHLTIRGGMQASDSTITPVVMSLWGTLKEVDLGTWKVGERAKCKLTVALTFYKLEIGGETIHCIDTDNMIRIINGVDQLAAMRDAIGT